MRPNNVPDPSDVNREALALVLSSVTTALSATERLSVGEVSDPELREGISHLKAANTCFVYRAEELGIRRLASLSPSEYGPEEYDLNP